MVELTLQISDELAERLKPLQNQLPQLLEQLIQVDNGANLASQIGSVPDSGTLVYAEVLDFLLTRPTPQQIVDYKVSPQSQERLHVLLTRNREASLTVVETQELDTYEQLEHFMILLKARAAQQL
ncbi:MAG: hypothetical protein F6K30_21865 [Cyanothece sp. SIO2G6]|nr:hypothetical protein [Cyanothece sp. SIO2G6]